MFLERTLILFFKIFCYSGYRRKYRLPPDFKFNGYFIRISGDGRIHCGHTCYVSFFSYINVAADTNLFLGDRVSIGHNVKIYTSTFDTYALVIKGERVSKSGDVRIGSNVLIGANVFICPGITIGNNVIVGANSVVTKDLADNAVYAGNPATEIKSYNEK